VNLDGSAVLRADPETVWAQLTDPAVLARTIPGCESLERIGEDSYRMDVSAGVGAIRGTYAGEVHLTDQRRPSSYVMHASGAGAPGQVRATVTIALAPCAEGTTLTWSADAVVGGPVAGVGQRMIAGVARRLAAQFFAAVDAELSGAAVPAPAAAAPAAAAPAAAAPAAAAPAEVFTGRASAGGRLPADVPSLVAGAAGGALIALLGVLTGYRLGRRAR
jgi:carbon monoxide dehydrogenase subunit G